MKIVHTAGLASAGLTGAAFALSAAFYSRLPDLVPTHWSGSGVADGFTPKPWGPFVGPLLMAGVYALFLAIPVVSPRNYRIGPFARVYGILQCSLVGFLFVVNALVLLAGTGARVDIGRALTIAAGVLFTILGNFMGKVTRNFFVGIRTPWTLASEEVWFRTHRLGGKLLVLGGIVGICGGLAGGGPAWIAAPMIVVAIASVVYSYVVYRKIEGFGNGS